MSTVEGRVGLYLNVTIGPDEMGRWSPDRIAAFFAGIARVIECGGRWTC